jgi:hypothetical protein
MLRSLVWVLLEQGRSREAETLAHAVIEIFEKTQVAPDSLRVATARADLARALELQGRDKESLGVYEVIRAGLGRDPKSLEQFFGGNVPYAELLVKTGRIDQGQQMLGVALERSQRLVGETHRETAEIRGSLAQAYAANGDTRRALREFREASGRLAARVPDVDAEPTAASQRLVGILSSYIGLLASVEGSPLARETGIDAVAESFRVADIARVNTVQRALGANAARAASPESGAGRGRSGAAGLEAEDQGALRRAGRSPERAGRSYAGEGRRAQAPNRNFPRSSRGADRPDRTGVPGLRRAHRP